MKISKKYISHKTNQKWQPTNYQRDRLISFTKKYITQKLNDLYSEFDCSNEFIFDFIKDI